MANESSSQNKVEVIPANATNSDVATSLNSMAHKLAKMLDNVVEDLSSIEVRTYTSEDLNKENVETLRARTKIALDGDTDIVVPAVSTGGPTQIDAQLWEIHSTTVDMAQTKRNEFLKIMAEIVSILRA